MKKLLLGCLILITACQNGTPVALPESTPTVTIQAPPEPATATATLLPTATASLTATPVPLYFIDEFSADLNSWTFLQTGGEASPTATIENDTLRLDIVSPHTWHIGIHNSNTYQNVSISTKFNGAPSGSIGLICRYSESGWYEFNVASDGTYSILLGAWLSDGVAQYIPIATDRSQYLQPGNMNYAIKLTCQDNALLLYINQTLFRKLDITSYGLPEGKVGITASSFEETPVTIFFDWLQVGID
jgi:hypothetical protein